LKTRNWGKEHTSASCFTLKARGGGGSPRGGNGSQKYKKKNTRGKVSEEAHRINLGWRRQNQEQHRSQNKVTCDKKGKANTGGQDTKEKSKGKLMKRPRGVYDTKRDQKCQTKRKEGGTDYKMKRRWSKFKTGGQKNLPKGAAFQAVERFKETGIPP